MNGRMHYKKQTGTTNIHLSVSTSSYNAVSPGGEFTGVPSFEVGSKPSHTFSAASVSAYMSAGSVVGMVESIACFCFSTGDVDADVKSRAVA